MALTLIKVPASAKRGEVIEIHATIGHPMETGFRAGAEGKILPRDIIQNFTCHYNGVLVFSAELFPAIAANPYIGFYTVALESGTLRLSWAGDNGFSHTQDVAISVT
jgi:sulfur-oxidizing protein SoxZ